LKSEPPGLPFGERTEGALVALAILGDDAAFSELVRHRQSWLRNLLRRLCRDSTLADDLAQLTLLQAWRALRTLRSAGAFQGWLRKLAINVWRQHLRSVPPDATPCALPVEDPDGGQGCSAHPALAAASRDVAAQIDLDRALAQLAPDVRLCVVLAYHEGMSHAQISALAALPLGTVKSHIRRGTQLLRAGLEAYRGAKEHCDGG
jgi:RNA polymerase sigma-70 factor (ECF subfamily)